MIREPHMPQPAPPEGDLRAVPDHASWRPLASEAYRRLADAFATVPDDAWGSPTPCAGWTVRDLGGHVLGAMRSAASLRETVSQQRAVRNRVARTGEQEVDALTAEQIERSAALTAAEVVAELDRLVGPAVAGRWRLPQVLKRRTRIRVKMGTLDERWDLEYFLGVILTRDAWLHRVDLADALGTELTLDEHDRLIVGDVAVEWARRHDQPVRLHLTGPAGGRLVVGRDGEELELDAVEFCRVVSGRSQHPHPYLAQEVPF